MRRIGTTEEHSDVPVADASAMRMHARCESYAGQGSARVGPCVFERRFRSDDATTHFPNRRGAPYRPHEEHGAATTGTPPPHESQGDSQHPSETTTACCEQQRGLQAERQHSPIRHPVVPNTSNAPNAPRIISRFIVDLLLTNSPGWWHIGFRSRNSYRRGDHGDRRGHRGDANARFTRTARRPARGWTCDGRRARLLVCRAMPEAIPESAPRRAAQQHPENR